jgi:hypothetical protein
MLGCPLEAAYPVVPLVDSHALSIGMTTVCDRVCFGVYADRETLPDLDALAAEIDRAIDELLARTRMRPTRTGRATLVAVPDLTPSSAEALHAAPREHGDSRQA